MAHHKSAKKRIRRNESARLRNRQYLSSVRTAVKNLRVAIQGVEEGTEKTDLKPLFVTAQTLLQKAATKGILHRKNAGRKIGRLAQLLKKVESGEKPTEAASKKKATKKKVTKKATTKKKATKKKATKKTTSKKK